MKPQDRKGIMDGKIDWAWFRFSDIDSVLAAGAAIQAVVDRDPRRGPMFVVTGPTRCGKNAFVRECLLQRFDDPNWHNWPKTERQLTVLLMAAVRYGYLWFDEPKAAFNGARGQQLMHFLTSSRWNGRSPGSSRIVSLANNIPVFLTTNDLALTPDLERRIRIISLARSTK